MVFCISLAATFSSLHIANKYQRMLGIGDSVANGIFIGAALFHLMPDAITFFESKFIFSPYLDATFFAVGTFIALYLIERLITTISKRHFLKMSAGLLVITLSIHAFITGLALGITNTLSIFSILMLAIFAHKGFEIFALVVTLLKKRLKEKNVRTVVLIFSGITPLGILLGDNSGLLFNDTTKTFLSACFNAVAAGTFFYIGLTHEKHELPTPRDSHHQYIHVLSTLAGIALMAILALWI